MAVVLMLAVSAAGSGVDEAAESPDARPYIVMIHADWCGTCRMLKPTWRRIESELGDRAHVVTLDVSDRAATSRSREEAERLGLSSFFLEYGAATGTIGVVDGETHQPIAVMQGEDDFAKYEEAIAKARP